ncbi:ComEA family DNA-binding protein [Hydrogenophaga sp. OTU3427]|uniref:ComEA family DNA-binding protein n=1 Tax=Hydrogenophaga sp. OTU3427 TaxID=3043856 RepID=UPI00313CAE0C
MHKTLRHAARTFMAAGLLAWGAVSLAAVDANTASAADLDSVKGVGPGTSSKIMDARKSGPFKDWNDLIDRVSGIGPGSATKLSANGLTVNGATYVGTTAGKAAAAGDKAPKPLATPTKDTAARKP